MVTDYQKICSAIERAVNLGKNKFIIYPYGEYGSITKQILNNSFGIMEDFIIDNKLSKYNQRIENLDFLNTLNILEYTVIFTCANSDVYETVRNNLREYCPDNSIVEIFEYLGEVSTEDKTRCGKCSYGPLCDHWLVESVGAFCSFAPGSDVVENHAIGYISTHPFLYYGGDTDTIHRRTWNDVEGERGYFEGINPRGDNYKLKKIKIGNDVWLGKNVLITNSSYIGNGVIAAAGAVITKNVPDYAVVAGVPARIIRYRYAKEEIAALNRIEWWNWEDDKIREHFDDFYLNIKDFIKKHDKG